MYGTFCIALSWPGYFAGTGRIAGVDPREMQKSDLIVVWGGNPVNTQVNVMTHINIARKNRSAKMVCVDIYDTGTMKQADYKYIIKPGTDGALACAIMHVLFRDGYANWDYLLKYTDCPKDLEAHLSDKTPAWAEAICGIPAADIVKLAELIYNNPRTYFRLGYGFSRSRNGAASASARARALGRQNLQSFRSGCSTGPRESGSRACRGRTSPRKLDCCRSWKER